ncbi:hypothetical protein OGAPHI_006743 [Ogataea philodendri]|uniref:Protein NBA1 n=1 Tax=Ogataea philodendri TaxID=1378263 RepID=A0A9P8T0D9_9ASCO|nr:uncharacterized protein OGAPHI_006743 [Ogataea philodendri]KAH3661336.1 hypothetical protein OGAPHI_006743 [Ogataea philodendri]
MSERSSVYSEMPLQKLTVTNPDIHRESPRDGSPHSGSSVHSSSPLLPRSSGSETWNKRVSNMSNVPGNRSSVFSEYSGVVQHVDIDTVKFVVDQDSDSVSVPSDRLSEVKKVKSVKLQHSSGAKDLTDYLRDTSPVMEESDKESIKVARTVPASHPSKPLSSKAVRAPDMEQYTELNFTIPARSPRRPNSGNFRPLDTFERPPQRPSVDSSNSSDRSSGRASGKFDDIMKEFEDLRSKIEAEADSESSVHEERAPRALKQSPAMHKYSPSAATSIRTGAESFHTARSIHDGQEDEMHPLTKQNSGSTLSEDSIFDMNTQNVKLVVAEDGPEDEYEDVEEPDEVPEPVKDSSKKKRAKKTKSKIKPFSYDTLARLLNATDGIVIGQEFANLDIPADEKYLIEQIVDSISRLTANMMLNPNRYKQGCDRLERVLSALEGFD